MKSILILRTLAPLALLAAVSSVHAEPEQIGDLRLGPNDYPGGPHYFEPGFTNTTRNVPDAPVQVSSVFSGTSQNAAPTFPGSASTDIGVITDDIGGFEFTAFKILNRYASDIDGDGPEPGAHRVGTVQYEIDLIPLETYLATSGDTLTALDLRLVFLLSDAGREYDVYLSYTNDGEGITETTVNTGDDPDANYEQLWWPAQAGVVGDVINGTHKILNLDQTGNLDQTTDLLALYNDGVRKVNVIVTSAAFLSNRTLSIEEFSGIHFETNAVGPEQVGDFRLENGAFPTFYHADLIGPMATRPSGGSFEVPSTLTAVSQNQGGNPPPVVYQTAGILNLDGKFGGTNLFNGNTATVTGFGPDGIGASASDAFQYTAWKMSDDFSVDVKLDSLTSLETGARAGLMVRGSQAADAAHAFVGVQKSGEPVVVTRTADAATASETLGAGVVLPQWLRIVRTGDLLEFFLSADGETYSAANPASATIVLTDPVYVGLASTSGSDVENAEAVFSELSETLASSDPATAANSDIALQTYSSSTQIRNLNRFENSQSVGMVQWAIDLSPLEAHLTGTGKSLDALSLTLDATLSDIAEAKTFDVYLSYTDPLEPVTLTGISDTDPIVNQLTFFAPAIDAFAGDIVGGTHKVLLAQEFGDIDFTEDLLALYDAGVRELNLIITSNTFYSNRTVNILEGSGLFIETSGGSVGPVVVTNVTRVGDDLTITVDGLTNGATYHLGGSATLPDITSIPDTDITATGSGDVLTATIADAAYFVQVLEGAAP